MLTLKIHRYIAREVLSPTLLCLLVFTMVLLMGRLLKLVDLVVNKGVNLGDILALFVTLLPSFMTISLPLAFLMGIMIGLGRMSADSETVALKASGISLSNLAAPVFSLALVFVILTGAVELWAKPWGNQAFKAKIFEITQKKATVGFRPRVFMDQFPGLVLYANELDDRSGKMTGLFIQDKRSQGTSWIFAREGDVYSDVQNETVTFRLHDGVIHHQKEQAGSDYQLIHFGNYDVQPDLTMGKSADTRQRPRRLKPKELPLNSLLKQISRTEGTATSNALQAELHHRLCTPLAPLLFALFGLPFSIQSHRSGRSGGFVFGLLIYLGYYILISLAETLTAESGISPLLSFWGLHLFLFTAGIFCLRQSSLEKRNPLMATVEQLFMAVKRRKAS